MDALNGFRVLVVTDVAQETQHQALAAGYQAFITKPFDIDKLLWRLGIWEIQLSCRSRLESEI